MTIYVDGKPISKVQTDLLRSAIDRHVKEGYSHTLCVAGSAPIGNARCFCCRFNGFCNRLIHIHEGVR